MSGGSHGSKPFSSLGFTNHEMYGAFREVMDVVAQKQQTEVLKALEEARAIKAELSGCMTVRLHGAERAECVRDVFFFKTEVELYPPGHTIPPGQPTSADLSIRFANNRFTRDGDENKWIIWLVDVTMLHIDEPPTHWLEQAEIVLTVTRDGKEHTHDLSRPKGKNTHWVQQMIEAEPGTSRPWHYATVTARDCIALKSGDIIDVQFRVGPTLFSPCYNNDPANKQFPLTIRLI